MKKIIAIVLLFKVVLLFQNCSYYDRKQVRKDYIGVFRLDIKQSKLLSHVKDTAEFKDLILRINENNTFSLNKETKFLASTYGTWKIEGSGLHIHCTITYGGIETRTDQFHWMEPVLFTQFPVSKGSYKQVEELVFVRVE